MVIKIDYDFSDTKKISNALKAAGNKMDLIKVRALNHTGAKARTAMIRALVSQTGMKRKTMAKALKQKRAFNGGDYVINAKGGNVRLMFFKPRENRKGVTAAPWSKRRLYPHTFMKGGSFKVATDRATGESKGGRVDLKLGRAVIQRAGKARYPLAAAPRSGLYIPTEMVKGNSEAVFYAVVQRDLVPRIAHELYRVLG